jgi:hypothetical protein
MAHFAKLDSNNIVENVIVISNEVLEDSEGNEVEQLGIDFCKSLYGENTNWVQTSYNSNIRKQYAEIGFEYDSTNDVFIVPQPFASWTLDLNYDWQPPTPYPSDNKTYSWNEETLSWDLFTPDSPFPSWVWNETLWIWEAPTPMPTNGGIWNEENQTWDSI